MLPRNSYVQPCSASLALPESIGPWYGENQAVSQRELEVLAQDTEFARKVYTDGTGDSIFVSVVLSGQDLNNSIHRPERCLPAQGWTIVDSKTLTIPMLHSPIANLKVVRLYDTQKVAGPDHQPISIHNLNYYWFIGASQLSASHFQREYIDIRDRVLKGVNQRWAYVTVAATITDNLQKFGRNEKQTDAMIQDFIQRLFPYVYRPSPARS